MKGWLVDQLERDIWFPWTPKFQKKYHILTSQPFVGHSDQAEYF